VKELNGGKGDNQSSGQEIKASLAESQISSRGGSDAVCREQRATFKFFLQRLRLLVANRPWQVSIVFIPDNDEMLANLANSSAIFQDLDPRRVEALKICKAHSFHCRDLTAYLYGRVVAEGQNPYLPEDRYFSLFGNQIVAKHYASIAKQKFTARSTQAKFAFGAVERPVEK
jgi:hypothetical protein